MAFLTSPPTLPSSPLEVYGILYSRFGDLSEIPEASLSNKDNVPPQMKEQRFLGIVNKVVKFMADKKFNECSKDILPQPLSILSEGQSEPFTKLWNQEEAIEINDRLIAHDVDVGNDCAAYFTSGSVLLIGPSIGRGVSREVRMGALITPEKVNFYAINYFNVDVIEKSQMCGYKTIDQLPKRVYKQIRTFQIQDALRTIEPRMPAVTNTLYWLCSRPSAQVNCLCILTELFNDSLAESIKRLNKIPGIDRIISYRSLQQVCIQLANLHENGIVHRDIHNRNILVKLEFPTTQNLNDLIVHATLTDCETVGPIIANQDDHMHTGIQLQLSKIGCLKEKPREDGPYHPPELRKPGADWIRDYTPAADIFAFGLLVLGEFGGKHIIISKNNYRYWDPDFLTPQYIHNLLDFLPGFAEIIIRAVAENPNDRPTAKDLCRYFK